MFEVLKIQMHETKSLFELNEKLLRSSFNINFGVRTKEEFTVPMMSWVFSVFIFQHFITCLIYLKHFTHFQHWI